jgi:hypothetical protein
MPNGAAPVAEAPEPTRAPEPPRPVPAPVPAPERPPGALPAPPAPARDREAAAAGPQIPGLPESFTLKLGPGQVEIPLTGAGLRQIRGAVDVNLADRGIAIPGVRFTRLRLTFTAANGITGGSLEGAIEAPFVHGTAKLEVDAAGNISGGADAVFEVAVLGRPHATFTYENRVWSGRVPIELRDLKLPIPNVVVDSVTATISFTGADLTGNLTATFHHAALGNGNVAVTLSNAGVTGSGGFTLTMPLLAGSHGDLQIANDEVSGSLVLAVASIRPPVPNLTISNVTGTITLAKRQLNGSFGLTAAYPGLATLTLPNVAIDGRGFAGGRGTIDVTAPVLAGTKGDFAIDRMGNVSGHVLIVGDKIPVPGLRNPRISITLREDGGVDVAGSGKFEIGSVGGGDFSVSYANGVLGLGVDVTVRVPYLHPVQGRLDYVDGDLSGRLTTGVTVGPLSGDVVLFYKNREFSGEGKLAYSQGRFNGWVLIRVDPLGKLSGEGEATFKLADWLTATIGLIVHPDLNIDAHGELVFPANITLFPAWKFEKNFFNFEQDFPLWGITIPVVGSIGLIASVHANAGFRAAFGPGTLRNIKATGDVSTRADQEPAFTLSAEFNVPAGAEIVLIVGGGIALAALIAKIEGGIDLNGIAGIYGAITLTPTFAYREGKYTLKGEALLAAAAQLKARINAYARVVAGIGWLSGEVWRKDWNLAEWVFDTGWNVGLKAGIEYVLGEPFEPKLSFDEVAVDPTAIIKGAIPESGEPVPAPPKPPTPAVEFKPAEGDPGQVTAGPAPPGAPAPTQPAPAAAAAPAPGAAAPSPQAAAAAGAAAAPPAPGATAPGQEQIEPPASEEEDPETRAFEDTYLVYVYESLADVLPRKKAPAAPSDDELRRQAHDRLAKGQPPPARPGAEPGKSKPPLPKPEAAEKKHQDLAEPATREQPSVKSTKLAKRKREEAQKERAEKEAPPLPGDERSHAKPLPAAAKTRMEAVFGRDLSEVRIHTDEASQQGAKRIGAEAYTAGRDIYFGPSRDPASHEELLAHELTHVLQQKGDRQGALGAPAGQAEREAEETAKRVKRGERPQPIRKRRDGAVQRAVDEKKSEPQRVDKAAKVAFTKAKWEQIQASPDLKQNKLLQERIAQLRKLEQVEASAKDEVYDPKTKTFRPRKFVPMAFPANQYLPHLSVTGSIEIVLGDYFERAGGVREDDGAQSSLAAMIKELPPELGEFAGVKPDPDALWVEYQATDEWKEANKQGQLEPEPGFVDESALPKTTASRRNSILTRPGYDKLWKLGYTYSPGSQTWRRRVDPAKGSTEDDDAAPATLAPLRSDYQAHHVIPLWLRSKSGRPDGDQIDNLAPWHKSAHQANHAVHHKVPDAVVKATDVKDYRDFRVGTPFLVHEWEAGSPAHPAGAPAVQIKNGKWKTSPTGAPIWMGGD